MSVKKNLNSDFIWNFQMWTFTQNSIQSIYEPWNASKQYGFVKFDFQKLNQLDMFTKINWGCPYGVMVKAPDCGIVVSERASEREREREWVSEFDLQLPYYVHFRTNTLGKGMG